MGTPARKALSWVPIWYTGGDNSPVEDEDGFLLYRAYLQPAGEDCLRVNVWTPEINGSSTRPVMVWLHGGGLPWALGTTCSLTMAKT